MIEVVTEVHEWRLRRCVFKEENVYTLQEGQQIISELKNPNRKFNMGYRVHKQQQMVNIHNFRGLCLFEVGYATVSIIAPNRMP